MFTGIELTDKGIAMMADYVGQVREVVGMEIPLSADHFGHIGVNSCIRLGRALEKYNLAWLEDMIPWQYTELWKQITDSINVPTLTGEDIYLKEGFTELCRNHAVRIIHPDLATSGGILETKKIGDAGQEYGVPMAMHFAGTPVSCMASVHCAAATENFLALENHSLDVPWWDDLVDGIEKPIVNHGYIKVPDKPGLGITLNEESVKRHLAPGSWLLRADHGVGQRALMGPAVELREIAHGNLRGCRRASLVRGHTWEVEFAGFWSSGFLSWVRLHISTASTFLLPAITLSRNTTSAISSSVISSAPSCWATRCFKLPAGVSAIDMGRDGLSRSRPFGGRCSRALATAIPGGIPGVVAAFIGVRFLLGVGESVIYPASNRLVAKWIPTNERGTSQWTHLCRCRRWEQGSHLHLLPSSCCTAGGGSRFG